jgi:transposase
MPKSLLTEELWTRIEGFLPEPSSPGPNGGRPPIDNRTALEGILFVLKTGIQWEDLPSQFGCSGMTCWRRLRDWQELGVWDSLHRSLLSELRASDKIDWERAVIDSASLRSVGGGEKTGPNPTDRRKLGSKHHVIVDSQGVPLAVSVTAANRNDVLEIIPLVADLPYVAGKRGHPRQRPNKLQGDRGYDGESVRTVLRWLGIEPILAKKNTEHGSGLGVTRWVVERTLAWLHNYRRLRVRWERRHDIHFAFVKLATSLICLNGYLLA